LGVMLKTLAHFLNAVLLFYTGIRPYSKSELKSNLRKILTLIVSLSVILFQLNPTKLKLEFQKSNFSANNNKTKTQTKFLLHHSSSTYFKFSLSLLLRILPIVSYN